MKQIWIPLISLLITIIITITCNTQKDTGLILYFLVMLNLKYDYGDKK